MPPSHWRNILHHDHEPDEAMQRIERPSRSAGGVARRGAATSAL